MPFLLLYYAVCTVCCSPTIQQRSLLLALKPSKPTDHQLGLHFSDADVASQWFPGTQAAQCESQWYEACRMVCSCNHTITYSLPPAISFIPPVAM
jgi:hypothetical protein